MSNEATNPFDSIEEAIAAIAAGEPVIVTDDESRENEGDIIVAGSKATPEIINLMIREARGLVCVPMAAPQLQRLGIHSMVANNRESHGTNFTVSVDATEGITTGIGAYDRYKTISILSDPEATPDQLVQPGHIFPLGARPGGVLQRAGHTEAAVDLVTLAGLFPVGVICEILKEDGSSARLPDLVEFKKKHGLKLVSIADLIHYRHKREKLVTCVAKLPFESEFGQFDLHVFQSQSDHRKHIALTRGELNAEPTLVRVHSENILGDIFLSKAVTGHSSLTKALQRVAEEGHGVVLYMEQPDGGVKLVPGADGEPALAPAKMDFRDYGIGAQILSELGLRKIRLLSSTERRVVALDGYDLEIVETVPL
ncbi:3,4-dihydroxy-2-butanone-4-phosphate synthase [Ruficoccus sp. ZRK36]|uniref:3,4-dihydroxy-2-butanone-4-phosphate synthase n=1 Tax=Ruficoccus sp. ZRK36 TaxID=2866311 RepID=UPI001C72DF73|nr:3,4-dihydroxy-2-butanone-4-phosphate synthase [Ruficoccus sp. ZRK36]QYY36429.1 3,4-dihydroxy-2-butanone-4-phosphate synthase [Ruficoccus sp. ZRK36]